MRQSTMKSIAERTRENRARRVANRMGWQLAHSRARILHTGDHGMWRLSDDRDTVVAGVNFDASIDEIEDALQTEQQRLRG